MRRIVVLAACAALAVPIVPAFAGDDVYAACAPSRARRC